MRSRNVAGLVAAGAALGLFWCREPVRAHDPSLLRYQETQAVPHDRTSEEMLSRLAALSKRTGTTLVRDITALVGAGPTQKELSSASGQTTDWLLPNHDYAGQRFVKLDAITPRNVASLVPHCMYQVGETTP